LRSENGRVFGDTIEGMDFAYLAKVTAINVAVLARLAAAPAAPGGVSVAGELTRDTTVAWAAVPGAARYTVRWRRNDKAEWSDARVVSGATEVVLKEVSVDDHYFGVSAVGADGAESIVTFAGRAARR
jgi:hypothetical protein